MYETWLQLMRDGLLLAGLPFVATALLIPLLKPFAVRLWLVDHPGDRKTHAAPTPLIGGGAIALGALATAPLLVPITRDVAALGVATLLMLSIGTLDDRYNVNWPLRIVAQAVAALAIFGLGGVQVESIGNALGFSGHTLGVLSLPFTILATVGIANAINWADGVDGLAGSLSLATFFMLICTAIYAGNAALVDDLIVMAGCVAAFLAYNLRTPWRPRASVFLGNGAEILGLWIAWASFKLTQTASHPVTPVLAPFLIAPPVIDCLVLIVRRLHAGRSPFSADRNHLHHHLVDAGVSTTGVVVLLVGLTLGVGFAAANARLVHVPEPVFPVVYLAAASSYYFLSRRTNGSLSLVQRWAVKYVSRAKAPAPSAVPDPALAPVPIEATDG